MADSHDDIRGKLGDVSGFEVGGKLGDVSGEETFEQLLGAVTQDQRKEIFHCLEIRVNRLEYQLFAISKWLDIRVASNTTRLEHIEPLVSHLESQIGTLLEQVQSHEERIRTLECTVHCHEERLDKLETQTSGTAS